MVSQRQFRYTECSSHIFYLLAVPVVGLLLWGRLLVTLVYKIEHLNHTSELGYRLLPVLNKVFISQVFN